MRKKPYYQFIGACLTALCMTGAYAQNTNLGLNAGNLGTNNTSIGANAGNAVTGSYNSFLGFDAGLNTTSAHSSTFVGTEAGEALTTGSYNSFFGRRAGFSTNGSRNSYFGYGAGYYSYLGDYNLYMGYLSGAHNNGGSRNTYVGSYSGYNTSSGSGNVFIGYGAGYFESGSDKLYIANTTSTPIIYGDFATGSVGLGTTSPGAYRLYVNGDAYATGLWVSSDRRFKQDIKTVEGALTKVSKISGVSYSFTKNQATLEKKFAEGTQLGLIAQDIKAVLPELVKEDTDGYMAVNYQGMIPVLIEAIKELHTQNEILKGELASMKELIGKSSDPSMQKRVRTLLEQNTPNPFRNDTKIRYNLPDDASLNSTIFIHNMEGNQVLTFDNLQPGTGEITISGNRLKPGLYYYTLVIKGEVVESRRMMLTE